MLQDSWFTLRNILDSKLTSKLLAPFSKRMYSATENRTSHMLDVGSIDLMDVFGCWRVNAFIFASCSFQETLVKWLHRSAPLLTANYFHLHCCHCRFCQLQVISHDASKTLSLLSSALLFQPWYLQFATQNNRSWHCWYTVSEDYQRLATLSKSPWTAPMHHFVRFFALQLFCHLIDIFMQIIQTVIHDIVRIREQ